MWQEDRKLSELPFEFSQYSEQHGLAGTAKEYFFIRGFLREEVVTLVIYDFSLTRGYQSPKTGFTQEHQFFDVFLEFNALDDLVDFSPNGKAYFAAIIIAFLWSLITIFKIKSLLSLIGISTATITSVRSSDRPIEGVSK